ncbi:hypothetical protein p4 [Esparto virus]|uniref:Uncharacterized protein n=1 Tax=Esparto virus TaxID=2072209 RepID=A0A2I7G2W1_9VIRU|nr:hypothetical protein p4 [Esparto virus]AUQ43980.1 hypothetical protein p4 [Esparto virus]
MYSLYKKIFYISDSMDFDEIMHDTMKLLPTLVPTAPTSLAPLPPIVSESTSLSKSLLNDNNYDENNANNIINTPISAHLSDLTRHTLSRTIDLSTATERPPSLSTIQSLTMLRSQAEKSAISAAINDIIEKSDHDTTNTNNNIKHDEGVSSNDDDNVVKDVKKSKKLSISSVFNKILSGNNGKSSKNKKPKIEIIHNKSDNISNVDNDTTSITTLANKDIIYHMPVDEFVDTDTIRKSTLYKKPYSKLQDIINNDSNMVLYSNEDSLFEDNLKTLDIAMKNQQNINSVQNNIYTNTIDRKNTSYEPTESSQSPPPPPPLSTLPRRNKNDNLKTSTINTIEENSTNNNTNDDPIDSINNIDTKSIYSDSTFDSD